AFARVDASAQAASTHANTVAENARLLKAAAGRLDGIIGEMRGTVTAVKDFDEQKRKQQQETGADRIQLAQNAPKADERQRDKAIRVLDGIAKEHPVSVAAVARRPVAAAMDILRGIGMRTGAGGLSESLGNWMAGSLQAGEIGDHYDRDVRDILVKEPTDANLRELAQRETEFWNSNRGSTVGALMTEDMRYNTLINARNQWLLEFSPTERGEIMNRLGLR
ncbi:MAG TPA: hypothetical protein VFV67_36045, partial [Actinophytocola sp.]|uniref:hypothetical protein n=1 Tax=Actinophytocola sp. TaxID=1872138 RepID=UPI002DB68C9B